MKNLCKSVILDKFIFLTNSVCNVPLITILESVLIWKNVLMYVQ